MSVEKLKDIIYDILIETELAKLVNDTSLKLNIVL